MARFGATGRVGVAADLDLEDLHGRAVPGPEEIVEDLGTLRFRVVDQQPAVAPAAADRADPVERTAGGVAVDRDGRRRPGLGVARGYEAHCCEQRQCGQQGQPPAGGRCADRPQSDHHHTRRSRYDWGLCRRVSGG
jgi:hypothetical protein